MLGFRMESLEAIIAWGRAVLADFGAEFDEAKGEYYYETILVKRSLEGESASGQCELCEENESMGWIDSEDVYPSGHDGPPFHPNAVFAGSTFAPYGRLQRMIAAEYEGMAITLDAGEYRTTIGPNHPMLTPRGLVKAKFLKVGDHLIHDSRAVKEFRVANHTDFDKIVLVENRFASLDPICGRSFVAASADDFHGDIVDLKKEVRVVFPGWMLLHEFDSFGSEHLCKGGLVLSNVHPKIEAARGALDKQLHAFLLTSARQIGGSDIGIDSLRHYSLQAIKAIRNGPLKTRAFDASTETGIYCSDGFVVSNCVCSEEYKEKRQRVYF